MHFQDIKTNEFRRYVSKNLYLNDINSKTSLGDILYRLHISAIMIQFQ